ncbi:MAG: hypothetical protein EXS13_10895 [Planctomycetes bacterium]|nr:hypothetical protein [Planctomycetota bacterium]
MPLAVFALVLAQIADAPPAEIKPSDIKNLVLVTIDTVRADRLSCYGYFRDTSPRLAKLAQESLVFTRCLTPIAQTTPSHWSIFTGVTPYEHQVMTNFTGHGGSARGRESVATLRTLAERLAEHGLKTGGFAASAPTKGKTGLDAGFGRFTEPEAMRRLGGAVIDDGIQFIEECGSAPFFTWMHLFDAHEPLKPPYLPTDRLTRFQADDAMRAWLDARYFPAVLEEVTHHGLTIAEMNDRYDSALRFLDDQLARLLDRLDQPDLRDTTALVIVADHGTAVGQHDHMGHGLCWDEQLRVPLLIRVPGVEPRVVDTACSTLDLWPTVFGLAPALANAEFAEQCRGSDVLQPGYTGRPILAVGAKTGFDAITAGRWKLMRDPKGARLYDLEEDPHERRDVAADHVELVTKLKGVLVQEIARHRKAGALHQRAGNRATIDPKLLEELRALGYTEDDPGGGGGGP